MRGIPRPYHVKYKDRHGVIKETRTWYVDLWTGGKRSKIPLGADYQEAIRKLKEVLGQTANGLPLPPRKLTLSHLLKLVEADYRANGHKSLRSFRVRRKILDAKIGHLRAEHVDTAAIITFRDNRIQDGAAPGTINLELAILSRAFSLGRQQVRNFHCRPGIPKLRLNNARQGFSSIGELRAILAYLPERWHALALIHYYTAWRPNEILSRQWRHVDFDGGWLRMDPGETKNRRGREFPLFPDLRKVLEWQRERCDVVERSLGVIVPWLNFGPTGKHISWYHHDWIAAREKAGLPHRLLYDFKRTRARLFEDARVPRRTAMAMMGLETEAMYRRYAIADRNDMIPAAKLIQAFEDGQEVAVKVSPIAEKKA